MATRQGPTDEQLAAAIEGARDMPEASRSAGRATGGESPIGSGEPTGPVRPDEAVKRETAVFLPGTHGKKPRA
jgi:hypothetical protein